MTQAKIPTGQGRSRLLTARQPTTPEKAMSEPTERSMPAEEMTKVMPIAMTPSVAVASRMLRALETLRKYGQAATVITAVITASTSTDSMRKAVALVRRTRQLVAVLGAAV